LHIVKSTAFKMCSIVDELLLLAEVRKADVKLEPLDMAVAVAAARERLIQMIEEYQATIVLPSTWPPVLGYRPWVEEVWANYLSNAMKYGGSPPQVRRRSRTAWCAFGCAIAAPASPRKTWPACSAPSCGLAGSASVGMASGYPLRGAS
jgi:light-regulated signal transduction histidine kinase (bacteriophytochrome)